MSRELVIRGVPRGLALDAWWFGNEVSSDGPVLPNGGTLTTPGARRRLIVLLALVVLADVLFWRHAPGVSLALFAFTVFAAVAIGRPVRDVWRPAVLVALAALPVIDYAQPLSVVFLFAGLVAAVAWLHPATTTGVASIGARMVTLSLSLPVRGLRDLVQCWRSDGLALRRGLPLRDVWLAWGFPLGGTLVLLTLLTDANPVLEDWLVQALDLQVDWLEGTETVLFWCGTALIVWPFIAPPSGDPAKLRLPAMSRRPGLGLNPASVLRALVLFNGLLAVQTVMDAALLWGGAAMPDGMSYAEYAHRGAYPLVITALLAGAFALAARPFLDENRWLRPLMMLWLLQNVALCVSSALRLELYVTAYGLTYLRIYVMIWIGLVAVGLCLTAWQIWWRRPNGWLLVRCVALAVGVLYASAFVNFAAIIAHQNLRNDRPVDWDYIAALPDTASAEIAAARLDGVPGMDYVAAPYPVTEGWRDWGFRRWRVARNMARMIQNDPAQ